MMLNSTVDEITASRIGTSEGMILNSTPASISAVMRSGIGSTSIGRVSRSETQYPAGSLRNTNLSGGRVYR